MKTNLWRHRTINPSNIVKWYDAAPSWREDATNPDRVSPDLSHDVTVAHCVQRIWPWAYLKFMLVSRTWLQHWDGYSVWAAELPSHTLPYSTLSAWAFQTVCWLSSSRSGGLWKTAKHSAKHNPFLKWHAMQFKMYCNFTLQNNLLTE